MLIALGKEDAYALLSRLYKLIKGENMPKILKSQKGKPYFENSPYHISVSHTEGFSCAAISESPIGVDVQKVRPVKESLVKKTVGHGEAEEDFFLLWCLKESFIKLKGGIDRPLSETVFEKSGDIYKGPDGTYGRGFYITEDICFACLSTVEGEMPEIYKWY